VVNSRRAGTFTCRMRPFLLLVAIATVVAAESPVDDRPRKKEKGHALFCCKPLACSELAPP
jgi:hypothetical protein